MSENNNIENIQIEKDVEDVEVIQPKKKQLSLKQLDHLNNIRVKALEKKKEIKLNKMKEYQEKNQKQTVIEEPIKPDVKPDVKSDVKPEVKSEVKKKRTVKKVIRYVETDSDDDDDEEEVIKKEKKKPVSIQQPIQQVKKSYNELLCESSLERMQSKIMNERAKHLITNIIPTYF
jgi:hypothetical protein